MNYDNLNLDNQLCFPLYACAKEVIKKYKPLLNEIGLTYTQYIAMMVMWEHKSVNVKSLGDLLYLDSGTMTPLLKRLERLGFVKRERLASDERNVMISITDEGEKLKEKAASIPSKMIQCLPITTDDATTLYKILYKILGKEK